MHTALLHSTGAASTAASMLSHRATTGVGAKSPRAKSVTFSDKQDRRLASWMKAAQAGDRATYENLLRASIPFIKMVVRRQGVAPDFVDDVVQDTLLTIHRIRETYDPTRSYFAWLSTIARRRAIDFVRSQGRTSRREVYEPLAFENHSDPTDNPEDSADQVNRTNVVEFAVATLPSKQREAVEQLALKGRSLADAAVATGLTPGALKVNLHRALNTLRARVEIANESDDRNSSELTSAAHDQMPPIAYAISKVEHAFVKSAM